MTPQTRNLLALGAAAVAVSAFLASGIVPDAPSGGVCLVGQARGPCAAANMLSATGAEFVCDDPNQQVYGFAEIVADPNTSLDGGVADLPTGFVQLDDSAYEVDCATFVRPDKMLTIRASRPGESCVVGPWVTDDGEWDGRISTGKSCDPTARCKAGATCTLASPLVHVGIDPTPEILCEVLGEAGCAAAKEKQRVSDLPYCEQAPENCPPPEAP